MPKRPIYAPVAQGDIARIRAWYKQPGAGRRAKDRLKVIRKAINSLPEHPDAWPEWQRAGTRRMVVEGHVVIYRVRRTRSKSSPIVVIEIVRIFGPGQDPV